MLIFAQQLANYVLQIRSASNKKLQKANCPFLFVKYLPIHIVWIIFRSRHMTKILSLCYDWWFITFITLTKCIIRYLLCLVVDLLLDLGKPSNVSGSKRLHVSKLYDIRLILFLIHKHNLERKFEYFIVKRWYWRSCIEVPCTAKRKLERLQF